MTRILFFDDGVGFGGSLVSLSELLDALELDGSITPTVIFSVSEPIANAVLGRHARRGQFRRLLTYQARTRFAAWTDGMRLPKVMRRLIFGGYLLLHSSSELVDSARLFWIIRKSRIDIVHCNNGWIDFVVRAARWSGRPCILHFRGFPTTSMNSARLRELDRTVRKAIAISSAVAQRLEAVGIPGRSVTPIHNPINLPKYREAEDRRIALRTELGWQESDIVVSIFGRVTPWKGQLEFLQAVQSIVKDVPSLRVLVVGDQSDAAVPQYLSAVKAVADSRELRGRVAFVGYQADPRGYYWASDIVVHNSVEPEPFGRVVTEAMACERPVVAMDEGGPKDIISNGHDGLLVPPRNISALATAIRQLADSPIERNRLGSNALGTVTKRFSHLAIGRQMLSVYRSLNEDR